MSWGPLGGSLGRLWNVSGGSLGAQDGLVSGNPTILTYFGDVLVSFLDVLEGLETSWKDKETEKSLMVDSCFRCRILIEIRERNERN